MVNDSFGLAFFLFRITSCSLLVWCLCSSSSFCFCSNILRCSSTSFSCSSAWNAEKNELYHNNNLMYIGCFSFSYTSEVSECNSLSCFFAVLFNLHHTKDLFPSKHLQTRYTNTSSVLQAANFRSFQTESICRHQNWQWHKRILVF